MSCDDNIKTNIYNLSSNKLKNIARFFKHGDLVKCPSDIVQFTFCYLALGHGACVIVNEFSTLFYYV